MKVIDIFAGAGGLSLGFASNPFFEIIGAYDNWNIAVKNYQNNLEHTIFEFDLSKTTEAIDHIQKFSPEIIVGGPPCQEFSHAGHRSEGKVADLTLSYALIVTAIKPICFVMENVDRAVKSQTVAKAREIFRKSGYGLVEKVLNASYCGVPQNRKRYFCIGILNHNETYLNTLIDNAISHKPLTVRDYLGEEINIEYYYRHPRNYNRRGIFSIDEPAPTIRGVNRPVPKGYLGHIGDPVRVTENLRSLTTYERSRLQTFPKSYKWIGTKTEIEQMIGNAVPVSLGKFIADRISEYYNQCDYLRIRQELNKTQMVLV